MTRVQHGGDRLASLSRGHDPRGSQSHAGLYVSRTHRQGARLSRTWSSRARALLGHLSAPKANASNSETDFAVGMARPFLDPPSRMFCNPFLAFHLAVTSAVHRQLQRHAVFGCDAEFHFLTDGWRTDQANGQNNGLEHLVPRARWAA